MYSYNLCSKSGKGVGGKMNSSCAPSYAPSMSIQPSMMPAEPTFVFVSDPKVWKEHVEVAREQGCSLASIRTVEENQEATELIMMKSSSVADNNFDFVFLGGILNPSGVISKSDVVNWVERGPAYWLWLDATPWTYENWKDGEPNSDEENSVVAIHQNDGTWANISPTSSFPALYRCSEDVAKREIP